MTVQELYDWALKQGLENAEIKAQYADDGGYYYGSRCTDIEDIETEELYPGGIDIII